MKTVTYNIVIDSISNPMQASGSQTWHKVDVSFHREAEDGTHDGFETQRLGLSDAIYDADGMPDAAKIAAEVTAKLGETETVELES